MSVGIGIAAQPRFGRLGLRLGLMAGAVVLAALVAAGLAWLIAPGIAAPPRPVAA
jgi:nickel/cobalt exporter